MEKYMIVKDIKKYTLKNKVFSQDKIKFNSWFQITVCLRTMVFFAILELFNRLNESET